MEENKNLLKEMESMQSVAKILNSHDKETIIKILNALVTMLELDSKELTFSKQQSPDSLNTSILKTSFSEDRNVSAKEFMIEKNPQTDSERIACLAYYLMHYRGQEEFKTIDLSKLNTEAAQLKFSNPTVAVDTATRASGFLVPTKNGFKKLSVFGERYVEALPNREEAKETLTQKKPRRRSKKSSKKNNSSDTKGVNSKTSKTSKKNNIKS